MPPEHRADIIRKNLRVFLMDSNPNVVPWCDDSVLDQKSGVLYDCRKFADWAVLDIATEEQERETA